MAKKTKTTIAKQHPVLYFYVVIAILLYLPFFIYSFHHYHKPIFSSVTQQQSDANQASGDVIGFGIYIAVGLYLTMSNNAKRIKLLLKIILVIQIISLLDNLLNAVDPWNFVVSVILAPYTYYTYIKVSGKKLTKIF